MKNDLVNESGGLVKDLVNDTISRAAALKGLEDLNIASFYEENEHSKEAYTEVKAMLKALPSAQPSVSKSELVGDAISRQAAETIFRNARKKLKPEDYSSGLEFHTRDSMLLNAQQVIHSLPSVTPKQPGWIPCSTALPEHDGEYLVTIKAFTIDQAVYADIDIARYTGGKWRKGFPVTAWQPLPTPYREGGRDNG